MHTTNVNTTTKALLTLTPLTSLRVSRHQIPAYGLIPNTSLQHKPVLIYHSVFPTPPSAPSQVEAHINAVGVCRPMWRYPMYAEDHFHSTAHEFLVVWRGRASISFGGEGCPAGFVSELGTGDAVLIPAGVCHRLVEDLGEKAGLGKFEMIGSYLLDAEHWDMCYGKPGEEEHVANIKELPWFTKDPLYGEGGPATKS